MFLTTTIDTILSDSPYQPPTNDKTSAVEPVPDSDSALFLPYAQLGLRLLGVMFFVDGVGAVFGGAIQGLFHARAYSDAGYPVPIDPHSVGWAAGGVPHLIAGLYLIVGGNWVLLNVFTNSRRKTVDSHENIDDFATSESD
jgi:hypothetical protein